MKLSSLNMPKWWQRLWNRRYPGDSQTVIMVYTEFGNYTIECMGCGCGYKVFDPNGERCGSHCPTIRGAMRRIRRDCA